MKVKDIKIENNELVVLAEARKPLNEFSYEYVRDILNDKDKIINGHLDRNLKIFKMTDFKVLTNGCWSFEVDIVEFGKNKESEMGDISYFLYKLKKELDVFESLLKTDNDSIYDQFKSVERIQKQLKLMIECREIKNKINKSDD